MAHDHIKQAHFVSFHHNKQSSQLSIFDFRGWAENLYQWTHLSCLKISLNSGEAGQNCDFSDDFEQGILVVLEVLYDFDSHFLATFKAFSLVNFSIGSFADRL